MASTAVLGFSIISRYHGGDGMRQARADLQGLRRQYNGFNDDMKKSTSFMDGLPTRWKAIAVGISAIGPALVPLTAQLLATTGALVTLTTVAAGAGGIFGAAMVGAVQKSLQLKKASDQLKQKLTQQKAVLATLTPGTKAYEAQLKKIHQTQELYNNSLNKGTPAQRAFNTSIGQLSTKWAIFIKNTEGDTLSVAAVAVNALASSFSHLEPVVHAVAPVAMSVAKALQMWVNTRLDGWVNFLVAHGVPALQSFVTIGKNLGAVFGDMLKAFASDADKLGNSLARGSAKLKGWADGGGFQRFLEYVHNNSPYVNNLLKQFFAALWNIVKMLDSFNPTSIKALTDVFRFIASIDPGAFNAFTNSFLLMRFPLAWLIINCPALRNLIIALLGSLNSQTVYAMAAAFVAWRLALIAVNLELLSTPVGWIILGLGALAVGIVWLATKTQFFQTVWKGIWAGVKFIWDALGSKWGWLVALLGPVGWLLAIAAHWSTVWGGIKTAAFAVWDALVAAWNATWNAIATAGGAAWGALKSAWNAVAGFFVAAWNKVSGPLSTAWGYVWGFIRDLANGTWISMQQIWGMFVWALKKLWDVVGPVLQAAWNATWNIMRIAAGVIWTAMRLAWDGFLISIKALWNAFYTVFGPVWRAAWTAIKAVGSAIWTAIKAAWGAFLTAVRAVWNAFYAAFSPIWKGAWNAIKAAGSAIWSAIKAAWGAFLTAVRIVWNTFWNIFSGIWKTAWNVIKTVASGIWNNIKDLWHAFATNGILGVWNTVNKKLKDSWEKVWHWVRDTAMKIWGEIQDAFKTPINFIIGGWNKVAGAVHLPTIQKLATGGPVKGAGTSTSDSIPTLLSHGEFVMNAKAVRHYGIGAMHDVNAMRLASGGLVANDGKGNGGGFLGAVGHAISSAGKGVAGVVSGAGSIAGKLLDKLKDVAADVAYDIAKPVLNGIVNTIPNPLPGIPRPAGEVPHAGAKTLVNSMLNVLKKSQDSAKKAMSFSGGGVGGSIPTGQHKAVIDAALKRAGVPVVLWPSWEAGLNTLITRESAWNPNAINLWDSNAKAGHPSKGLMQTIDSTFNAYGLGGSIYDPVSNIVAGIRYIQAVYGGIGHVQQANASAAPKGYALGTPGANSGLHLVGENGAELVNFRGGERVETAKATAELLAGAKSGGDTIVNITIPVQGDMTKEAVDRVHRELVPTITRLLEQGVV